MVNKWRQQHRFQKIVVQLFGVGALWIACVIGYLACFASLNIYIQSFARLGLVAGAT